MTKSVVVIGGGTGNFVTLSALRSYPVSPTAIVTMADDGGSTGILRDELGVLPPGDVRQCLVALSNSSELMRRLMNYRFETGGLEGHSFGNLLLSALEKVTGSFDQAVQEVGHILSIQGAVLPVTTNQVRLRMVLNDGKVLEGEREIYNSEEIDRGYKSLSLEPHANPNPRAIEAILATDVVVFGPGCLHTSLIPNLLVGGLSDALNRTSAKRVFVVNLMNRRGQTTGFRASDYVREIGRYLGGDIWDHFLINVGRPAEKLLDLYRREGEIVENDMAHDPRVMAADFLREGTGERVVGDKFARSLIRHDSTKLAKVLMQIVNRT